jgi:hypothetical protein
MITYCKVLEKVMVTVMGFAYTFGLWLSKLMTGVKFPVAFSFLFGRLDDWKTPVPHALSPSELRNVNKRRSH